MKSKAIRSVNSSVRISALMSALIGGLTASSASCSSPVGTDTHVKLALINVRVGGQGGAAITLEPGGILCKTACSAEYASGTQVRLSAAAMPGAAFDGWSGSAEGIEKCTGTAATCEVKATGASLVIATYHVIGNSPPLPVVSSISPTYVSKAGGSITISGSGFQPGTQVSIGGAPAQLVSYVSPTELKVMVGAGSKAGCAPLVIKNTDGQQVTLARSLAYAPSTTSFGVAKTLSGTASTPKALQAGDFDSDGKLDLLLATNNSGKVQFLKGNGDGTYQAAVDAFTGAGFYDLRVLDVDSDGNLDALVVSAAGSKLLVLAGSGDGTFTKKNEYATGTSPYALDVGDFNGDGKADVVTGNSDGMSISVLIGNGDGSFRAAQNTSLGERVVSVVAADLNGDKKLDTTATTAVSNAGKFFVFLGSGDGNVQPAVSYNAGAYFSGVAAGDLDGDGFPELAGGDLFKTDIKLRKNGGDGTFATAISSLVLGTAAFTTFPYFAGFFDVNMDGKLDVVGTSSQNGVSYFLNQGNSTFTTRVDLAVGTQPEKAIFTDLNGDCLPDFATVNLGANSISVVANTSQ
jgi:hypothetical protein